LKAVLRGQKGRSAGFKSRARPGIYGVSVRVVGIRLGLRVFSKPDDNHGNANGELEPGFQGPPALTGCPEPRVCVRVKEK